MKNRPGEAHVGLAEGAPVGGQDGGEEGAEEAGQAELVLQRRRVRQGG